MSCCRCHCHCCCGHHTVVQTVPMWVYRPPVTYYPQTTTTVVTTITKQANTLDKLGFTPRG